MTVEYSEDAPSIEAVNALKGDTIIEFGAPWCSHCQTAEPFIKEALKAHPTIRYIKVYDGKGKRLGRFFYSKVMAYRNKIIRWPRSGSYSAACELEGCGCFVAKVNLIFLLEFCVISIKSYTKFFII